MNKTNILTSICVGSLLLSSTLYANHHKQEKGNHSSQPIDFTFVKKDALTINRTSSFELDMTPERALPLFTAPGEVLWAPGWQPNILSGDGFEQGTVWLTKHHDVTTYWYVTKYDKKSKEALYTRVAPDSNMGTVSVTLSENEKGGSKVVVTYKLTSLSPDGNKMLTKQFNEQSYNAMVKEWRELILKNMNKINAHN